MEKNSFKQQWPQHVHRVLKPAAHHHLPSPQDRSDRLPVCRDPEHGDWSDLQPGVSVIKLAYYGTDEERPNKLDCLSFYSLV
jgi:hypothetical protein